MPPKVSVVMPVYNAEAYLPRCLDSILTQSLRDIEIICVDDGSTDTSSSILNHYAKKDKRISIIQQQNLYAGVARNTGLAKATGEYISFLDADDFFEQDMLKTAYCECQQKNADIGVFRCDLFDHRTQKPLPCHWALKKKALPDHNPFSQTDITGHIFNFSNGWAWDKLYSRRFIERHRLRFQSLKSTNDLFFVYSAYAKAEQILFIDRLFAHKRVNVPTALTMPENRPWDDFLYALIALKDELTAMGIYPALQRSFVNLALELTLFHLNMLPEPAFGCLYNRLRNSGFQQLDMMNHDKDYFYHKNEYSQFKRICETPYTQYTRPSQLMRYAGKCWDVLAGEGVVSTLGRIKAKVLTLHE